MDPDKDIPHTCCKYCGSIDTKITLGPFGPHWAKEMCNDCGRFIKWVAKLTVMEDQHGPDTGSR